MRVRITIAVAFWIAACVPAVWLVAAVSTLGGVGQMLSPPFWVWVSIAAALLFAVSYWLTSVRENTASLRPSTSVAVRVNVSPDSINFFRAADGSGSLTFDSVTVFLDAIAYPTAIFDRITETATPWHRSIILRSTYTVALRVQSIPEEGPDLVVPLFLFPKGQLQDGLRVYDSNEKRLSTLPRPALLAYALAVARDLARSCGVSFFAHYLDQVEPEVVDLWSRESASSEEEIATVVGKLDSDQAESGRDETRAALGALIAYLSQYHPISVGVPRALLNERMWPDTFRFRIEHRIIPTIRYGTGIENIAVWLRFAMGVRLNRFRVPIPNATRTMSYHLEVAGPDGTYLAAQELGGVAHSDASRVRMQPRRAQRRAHLYLQDLEYASEDAAFQVGFFERSPGALAKTTAAGWSAFVLIAALAAIRQVPGLDAVGLYAPQPSPLASSVLAGLLAFPAAITAWNRTGTPTHPSLLSRFLSFAIILESLVAFVWTVVALDALQSGGATLWASLTLVALLVALLSSFSWLLRLAYEFRFFRRMDWQTLGT